VPARNQNNFGLRVEQPPLSDVVNKANVFQLFKIGKKFKAAASMVVRLTY